METFRGQQEDVQSTNQLDEHCSVSGDDNSQHSSQQRKLFGCSRKTLIIVCTIIVLLIALNYLVKDNNSRCYTVLEKSPDVVSVEIVLTNLSGDIYGFEYIWDVAKKYTKVNKVIVVFRMACVDTYGKQYNADFASVVFTRFDLEEIRKYQNTLDYKESLSQMLGSIDYMGLYYMETAVVNFYGQEKVTMLGAYKD